MRRADYVLRRTAFALATILVAITLNFVLFRAVPGDAVDALRCLQCSAEFRDSQRAALGLDRPVTVQFWTYLTGLVQGDLGRSMRTEQPVTGEIAAALKNSLPLMALGVGFALLFGIVMGVVASWRRDTLVDRAGTWSALALNSMPAQWLGLLMVLLVAERVGLPASGVADPIIGILGDASAWDILVDRLKHMVLPALTLAFVLFGNYTLIMRSAMVETLGEDYVLTARAKGLTNWQIVWRHGLRNALLPVITLIALSSGFLIGGSITIEYVFSYPGVGLTAVEAINQRDWPVLQGIFLLITVVVILANLAADLLYAVLDPRVST